jgi:hypothetical protein
VVDETTEEDFDSTAQAIFWMRRKEDELKAQGETDWTLYLRTTYPEIMDAEWEHIESEEAEVFADGGEA